MSSLRVGIIVVSDRAASGDRRDRCVEAVRDILPVGEAGVAASVIVPDEIDAISDAVRLMSVGGGIDLIVTAGGTGLGERDLTPEAVIPLIEKRIPGIEEIMRAKGFESTPTAILSRSVAGTIGKTLFIALPGSPRGASESLSTVWPAIPHAIDILRGRVGDCGHIKKV